MKPKNNQFVANLIYTIAFLVVSVVICIKWYSIGFTWHDRFAYFGSILGLIYFSGEVITEHKRLKKK